LRYVKELKFKKKFPFIYIHKRKEYITERIARQYRTIVNVLPIVYMMYGFGKLMTYVTEKISKNLEDW